MSKSGLLKFGAVVGAIAATVAGTAAIANRSAEQNEEALFAGDHPENTGFSLGNLPGLDLPTAATPDKADTAQEDTVADLVAKALSEINEGTEEQKAAALEEAKAKAELMAAEERIAAAERAAAEARAAAEKAEQELKRMEAEKVAEAERKAEEEEARKAARAAVAARQERISRLAQEDEQLARDLENGKISEPDFVVTENNASDRIYRRPLSRAPLTDELRVDELMSAEHEAKKVDATVIKPAMSRKTPEVELLPLATETPEVEKLGYFERRRKAKEEKAAEKIRLAEEKAAEEARIAEEKAKAAEEARLKAEAEAKAKAEEEARLAEEARLKAEAEAKAKAEEEARLAEEARLKAEAEAKAKAEEEARLAEEARLKAEAEAKAKAEEEARLKAEAEAKAKAEEEARLKAEAEAKAKAEEEARLKAEAEAKAKAEEEARLKAEAEAKAKAEEEARLAEEARLKAEAEAKAKAEEEARLAEEARLKAEAEAKAKAEEEARLKAEAEKAAKLAAEAKLMEEAHEFYDGVEPDEYIDTERIEIYMDPNVNTITVGGAVVSDDPANENIVAVAEAAGVKAESLVSLVADGNAPLVFEFADPTERNEVTLQNVYFINGDGKVTMPSRKDNDNILAFGKAFITDIYGFKAFLDRK